MTDTRPTIGEIFDLPEVVHRGDFVLKLTEGVHHAGDTLRDYVVTPQLVDCFDDALSFVASAVESGKSKAAYLHGSFGSGKSHFMAVLYMLLQQQPAARARPELAAAVAKHDRVLQGKKFLMVPYHMIGARSLEQRLLGHYVQHVREVHPDAPLPGVYLADRVFADAQRERATYGDDKFFERLNAGQAAGEGSSAWGEIAGGWDAESFERAQKAPPYDPERARLVGDLVDRLYSAYRDVAAGGADEEGNEGFVDLDDGLAILSAHAKDLGYDAVVLFLDELILWLATHVGDMRFLQREGQKISKLVESSRADRPVPVVSFIARQRDLREFIGEQIPGAEQQSFGDVLNWWEGRFHRISLEDRNLPAIAQQRLLRPRDEGARARIDEAFEETKKLRAEVRQALLGSEADEEMFHKVYPFSPALVRTLVAVSSVLQRERTALKIMAILLSKQRDRLRLGEIMPVGDLWDVLASGDEPFSQAMRAHFDNAKRLWDQKLLPMLEREHNLRLEEAEKRAWDDPAVRAFYGDGRILKTLLLASLAPEEEALKGLTAGRLVGLNWGSIRSPIPHREAAQLVQKLQRWGSQVGEIELIGDLKNPEVGLRISSVDVDQILAKAQIQDSFGNRKKKVRELLFGQLGIPWRDELPPIRHEVDWRGTRRIVEVIYDNVRELPLESFRAGDAALRVVLDFPFDEAGHGPREDLARVDEFREREASTPTVVWLPAHFGPDAVRDLGKLVVIDFVLAGERFDDYADHLSAVDRQAARSLLQNQSSQLRLRIIGDLQRAFGLDVGGPAEGEGALPIDERVQSLSDGIRVERPVGANLGDAFVHLVGQALAGRWPGHPDFGERVRPVDLKRVWEQIQEVAQTEDGRGLVPKEPRGLREAMRNLAGQLRIGEMHEDAFVLGEYWKKHFDRRAALDRGSVTVGGLREWIDDPQPMGLQPEFADLIVMTFAAQTNRRFLLHGGPCKAEIGKLDPAMELREQALPKLEEWREAIERAGKIFGVSASPLLNAANVAELEAGLKATVDGARGPCRDLWRELDDRLRRRGMEPGETDRMRTAQAVSTLVDRLSDGGSGDAVPALCEAKVPTTPEAMGRSFRTAGEALEALRKSNWQLIDGLTELPDAVRAEGKKAHDRVAEALRSDELVLGLAGVLRDAEAKSTMLMRQALASSSAPSSSSRPGGAAAAPPPAKPTAGYELVDEQRQEALSAEDARRVLGDLANKLEAGDRLSLSWRIERRRGDGGGA